MSRDLRTLSAVCALLLGLAACGDAAPKEAAPAPSPAPNAAQGTPKAAEPAGPAAEFSGRVRGIIKLPAGVDLPLAPAPDTSAGQLSVPEGCAPFSEADRRTVRQHSGNQGLTPVHVAITQMQAAPPRAPITHELRIENCRLTPFLVGAMRGDKLRIVNASGATFLPVLPGDAFMQGLLAGKSREIALEGMGPQLVQCGFAGYCGQSLLVTVAHSLYAVSDDEGRFTISGIPLDQELVLHAWHPLFDVTSQPFKLTKAEAEKVIDLELKPVQPPEPPSSEPAPAPKAKQKAKP